jgi:hypothetical protein
MSRWRAAAAAAHWVFLRAEVAQLVARGGRLLFWRRNFSASFVADRRVLFVFSFHVFQ